MISWVRKSHLCSTSLISSALSQIGRIGREHLLEHAGADLQLVGHRDEIGVELLFARNQAESGHASPSLVTGNESRRIVSRIPVRPSGKECFERGVGLEARCPYDASAFAWCVARLRPPMAVTMSRPNGVALRASTAAINRCSNSGAARVLGGGALRVHLPGVLDVVAQILPPLGLRGVAAGLHLVVVGLFELRHEQRRVLIEFGHHLRFGQQARQQRDHLVLQQLREVLAQLRPGEFPVGLLGIVGVHDGHRFAVDHDRQGQRELRRASERHAAGLRQFPARPRLDARGGDRLVDQRVERTRNEHLRDVGVQVEADLPHPLEPIALDAEQRDAAELGRQRVNDGGQHLVDRRAVVCDLVHRQQSIERPGQERPRVLPNGVRLLGEQPPGPRLRLLQRTRRLSTCRRRLLHLGAQPLRLGLGRVRPPFERGSTLAAGLELHLQRASRLLVFALRLSERLQLGGGRPRLPQQFLVVRLGFLQLRRHGAQGSRDLLVLRRFGVALRAQP